MKGRKFYTQALGAWTQALGACGERVLPVLFSNVLAEFLKGNSGIWHSIRPNYISNGLGKKKKGHIRREKKRKKKNPNLGETEASLRSNF